MQGVMYSSAWQKGLKGEGRPPKDGGFPSKLLLFCVTTCLKSGLLAVREVGGFSRVALAGTAVLSMGLNYRGENSSKRIKKDRRACTCTVIIFCGVLALPSLIELTTILSRRQSNSLVGARTHETHRHRHASARGPYLLWSHARPAAPRAASSSSPVCAATSEIAGRSVYRCNITLI